MPVISVVTATLNVRPTVERLAESLSLQTSKDFEWIVVDGGSDDGTVDFLEAFSKENPWCLYVSEPDSGIYDALNKGIRMASGDFYLVIGADDYLYSDAVYNYHKAVIETSADIVLANVIRNGRIAGGFKPQLGWAGHQRVFLGSHSVGMLIRNSLHGKIGYYSPLFPMLADGYFLKLALSDPEVKFGVANFVAGRFSVHGISSTDKVRSLAETWLIQMATERSPIFQTVIFIGKIVLRLLSWPPRPGQGDNW